MIAIENNVYSTIEANNREINALYEEIERVKMPIASANEIREYLHKWNEVKDKVLDRVRQFKNNIQEKIFYQEITEILNYMNPIPLEQLAKYLSLSLEKLKEQLFGLIQEAKINARIKDNQLLQPEKSFEERILQLYRKVEIIGSKLSFSIRIYNPSKYFVKNLELAFVYPEILELIPDLSDATEFNIREFEPEASRVINWNFKIQKSSEKKYDVQRFFMNISYINPFDNRVDFQKEMEMIV